MADEGQSMQGNHEPSEAPDAPWVRENYHTPDPNFYIDFDDNWMSEIIRSPSIKIDEYDIVDRPAHYNQGQYEVIDVIQDKLTKEQFRGYLEGNILKYVLRHQYKGHPKQDLQKAQWYLNRMVETFND
jgi:hypothetical protein